MLSYLEALSEVSVPTIHLRHAMAGYLEYPKVPLGSSALTRSSDAALSEAVGQSDAQCLNPCSDGL